MAGLYALDQRVSVPGHGKGVVAVTANSGRWATVRLDRGGHVFVGKPATFPPEFRWGGSVSAAAG